MHGTFGDPECRSPGRRLIYTLLEWIAAKAQQYGVLVGLRRAADALEHAAVQMGVLRPACIVP